MKKILLAFYIIFLFAGTSPAQNFKFGWITDLHIGSPGAESDLENVVHNINGRQDIKFVVVTGDIGEKGRNSELQNAKKILDSLNVKYYIIPGNHDTKWSESGCAEFNHLWGNDKFAFEYDSVKNIGLNSGIPWRGGGGHVSPEDLRWLDSVVTGTPLTEKILFYVHHPLDEDIDNWFKVTNILRQRNVKAVLVGHGHANKLMNFNGIPGAMSRSSLNKGKKSWGYTLAEMKPDSIIFYEVNKDSIPEFWGALPEDSLSIPDIDSVQFINYTESGKDNGQIKADTIWSKDLGETLSASLLPADGKIFAATVNGNVFCFDSAGRQLWEYKSGERIFSRPAYYNGTVVIATMIGDIIELDAGSGRVLQSIGLGVPLTSQLITIGVNYNGEPAEGVVVGTSKGDMYCYDLNTLEMIWENHSAKGMIETRPLAVKDRIIYGSWDGHLYCIAKSTGLLNWKWTENNNFYYSPAACWPVSDGKNVYVCTPDKHVSSIDLLLGTTNWRKDYGSWESIGIDSTRTKLFIKGIKDEFSVISAKNGKNVKKVKVEYGLDTMPVDPIEWRGNILFGSKNGTVYLIDRKYNPVPLFFLGTARLQNIFQIGSSSFALSNMDGKIFFFKIIHE